MTDLRATILETLHAVAEQQQCQLVDPLNDEVVLLESGLDSLGFAILVAMLEEQLEFDPFTLSETPVYPRTLGEFIACYEQAPRP